ncbi:MAG: hypothetical protein ACTSQA_01345, partial [Candidatus Heimdallarchaeaceae archaeon]
MKRQEGISTTLSILLVVLLIVIVGGGVVHKYYLAPEETPFFGEILRENQDETIDWEIYKSTHFGFEMKYPQEWFLYDNEQNISTVKPGEWLPIGTLPKGNAKIWFERTGVQSIDDLVAERFDSTTNNIIVSDSIINLDNLSGREIVYTCNACEE